MRSAIRRRSPRSPTGPKLRSQRPERELLRETFEQVPELYERARPLYPAELFDELVELCGLERGGRVLEIGPGTGQATRPLAERGLDLVGIELGERLAEVVRRRLRALSNVRIVTGDFETWQPEESFDAVVAFTAFHWIDPDIRYQQAARALGDGGALAVVETRHVLPAGGDAFWAEVQDDYDAVVPSDENRPPPAPDEVPDSSEEIAASELFRRPEVRRYVWDVPYTADEYIAVLDTYSGHRSMGEEARHELYRRIRRRIETRSGGRVRKTYLAILNVARKR